MCVWSIQKCEYERRISNILMEDTTEVLIGFLFTLKVHLLVSSNGTVPRLHLNTLLTSLDFIRDRQRMSTPINVYIRSLVPTRLWRFFKWWQSYEIEHDCQRNIFPPKVTKNSTWWLRLLTEDWVTVLPLIFNSCLIVYRLRN